MNRTALAGFATCLIIIVGAFSLFGGHADRPATSPTENVAQAAPQNAPDAAAPFAAPFAASLVIPQLQDISGVQLRRIDDSQYASDPEKYGASRGTLFIGDSDSFRLVIASNGDQLLQLTVFVSPAAPAGWQQKLLAMAENVNPTSTAWLKSHLNSSGACEQGDWPDCDLDHAQVDTTTNPGNPGDGTMVHVVIPAQDAPSYQP